MATQAPATQAKDEVTTNSADQSKPAASKSAAPAQAAAPPSSAAPSSGAAPAQSQQQSQQQSQSQQQQQQQQQQQGGNQGAGISGVSGGPNTKMPHASSSLYVGDLAKEVTEATLFELFNAVGPVASIRVCRDATTRTSLGYAYVNFHSQKDAERALDTMNFVNIRGRQCRIMWSQRDPGLRHSNKGNIFVKNLHESIDNKTLYDTFSVFGSILSCKVATNSDSTSRCYGYVHYADEASAKKAIEGVNGMSINEQVVAAEPFRPRSERQKSLKFTNVYIKYIPRHVTEDELAKLFIATVSKKLNVDAEITAKNWRDEPFGISACFNFKTYEQAQCAVLTLNGYDVREVYPEPSDEKKDESNKDENKESEKEADDNDNEKEEEKASEDKDETTTKDESKTEDKEQQPPIISGVTSKDSSKNAPKAQPKGLYVSRAQKRKERKFEINKQARGRIGPFGRGGYGGGRKLGSNLYVKHLDATVDDEKLKELFSPFGEIISAKVMKDEDNRSKGFGFVAFKTKESATRALHDMTNTMHNNKPLYVSRAQSKAYRQKLIMKQVQRDQRMRRQAPYQGPYSKGNVPQNFNNYNQPYGRSSGAGGVYGNNMNQNVGVSNLPINPMSAVNLGPAGMNMGAPGGMNMNMNPNILQGRLPLINPMQPNLIHPMQPNLLNMQRGIGLGPGIGAPQANLPNAAGLNLLGLGNLARPNVNVGNIGNAPLGGLNPNISAQQALQAQVAAQSSQTNQIRPNVSIGAGNIASVGANIANVGSQVNTNPASSANVYTTPVPRQGGTFSVQSGVAAGSQMASAGNQPQQSASVISTGNQPSAPMKESQPLTAQMLNTIKTPAEKKRLIGERLFPKIQVVEPRLAGKITGMLLEMENKTLLTLLNDNRQLHAKINEALAVLQEHHQKSQQNASNANRASSSNVQG